MDDTSMDVGEPPAMSRKQDGLNLGVRTVAGAGNRRKEKSYMDIGKRLAELRGARELSQGDIEKRTGLLRCYISRVENGHTTPSLETLERWAIALEIEFYQLFFEGKGEPESISMGAIETLDIREGDLLGYFRRVKEADRNFMLEVGRRLAE
jgi:transcriptional regulator with XRE-family HTH domain